MSKVICEREELESVANAVRKKCNTTNKMSLKELELAIYSINNNSQVTVILEESTYPISYIEGYGDGYETMSDAELYTLNVGETYYVRWNGVTYETQAIQSGVEAIALGNVGALTGEGDNGLPFIIACIVEEPRSCLYLPMDRRKVQVTDTTDNHIIIPEQFTSPFSEADGVYGGVIYGGTRQFVIGRTYTVNWEGTTYETQAADADYYEGFSGSFIGNVKFLSGNEADDNGLPFSIISTYDVQDQEVVYVFVIDQSDKPTSFTVEITQGTPLDNGSSSTSETMISKFGTYTPSEDAGTTVVTHGLGVVPDFIMVMSKGSGGSSNAHIMSAYGMSDYFKESCGASIGLYIRKRSGSIGSDIDSTITNMDSSYESLGFIRNATSNQFTVGYDDSATHNGGEYHYIVIGRK